MTCLLAVHICSSTLASTLGAQNALLTADWLPVAQPSGVVAIVAGLAGIAMVIVRMERRR